MTDEEGDLKEKEKQEQQIGECEQAQETNRLQEKGKNTKQHTHAIPRLVQTLHDGWRSHSSPRVEEKQ